jgi:aldehyde:ferredoxin oxidoreductase
MVPRPACTAPPDELSMMLDRYYELRGWDADGVPTPDRLRHLGL